LLRVLERPEIPLNTNASENDIRAFVTIGGDNYLGRSATIILAGRVGRERRL
jgi:hypothetical protein